MFCCMGSQSGKNYPSCQAPNQFYTLNSYLDSHRQGYKSESRSLGPKYSLYYPPKTFSIKVLGKVRLKSSIVNDCFSVYSYSVYSK